MNPTGNTNTDSNNTAPQVPQAQFVSRAMQALNARGFIKDCSSAQKLDALLSAGPATVYCGFDLTAPSLHIGNLMALMMLRIFLQNSHKVIILLGGATTKIGDPTGKDETRRIIPEDEILSNAKGIKKSILTILEGDKHNGREESASANIQFVDNSDWFCQTNYIDFLANIGRHFSVNRMLAMDSVKNRLDQERSMSFIEFNYILMQSYDFYHLAKNHGCTVQIGGSDQWGNITNGVDLCSRMQLPHEVFGLTCPLLTRSDGKKMGKSEQGAIWINEDMLPSYNYYQYFRDIPDADTKNLLYFYTDLPPDQVERLASLKGKEANAAKEALALEATKICRGGSEAHRCEEAAKSAFSGAAGAPASNMPSLTASSTSTITELCAMAVGSKSEARRLIEQGAIKINAIPIQDATQALQSILEANPQQAEGPTILSVGKKRHFALMLENTSSNL